MLIGLVILYAIAFTLLVILGVILVRIGIANPTRVTEGAALARGQALDPGDVGLQYEIVDCQTADKRTIPVWVMTGENPDGPEIVLMHGWGDSRHGALNWARIFSKHASRLITWDHRGHGVSESPSCEWGPGETDDAAAIMDQLLTSNDDDKRCVLVGLSMGAAIALQLATRREDVSALVLDSPYTDGAAAVKATLRFNLMPAWPLVGTVFSWMKWRNPKLRHFNNLQTIAEVAQPILLLQGESDHITPLAGSEALAAAGRNVVFVKFPECNHLAAAGRCREEYQQAVNEFLIG